MSAVISFVVLIICPAHAIFSQTDGLVFGLTVLAGFEEGIFHGYVNVFNHRGQHRAWEQVVLLSTPIAYFFESLVWYTPLPAAPAAAKITSTPRSNCERANSPPLVGLFHASPVVPTMFSMNLTFGLAHCALLIATRETTNHWMSVRLTKPTGAGLRFHRATMRQRGKSLLLHGM